MRNDLFEAFLPQILEAIDADWTAQNDKGDQIRANRICWAWAMLPQVYADCGNDIGKTLEALPEAVRSMRYRQWGMPAMRSVDTASLSDTGNAPLDSLLAHDGEDCEPPYYRIVDLPSGIREVAVLLSRGLNRETIAKTLGVSYSTVRRRIAQLEVAVLHLRERQVRSESVLEESEYQPILNKRVFDWSRVAKEG